MKMGVERRSCRPFRAHAGGDSTQGSASGSTLGYIPAAASRLKVLVIARTHFCRGLLGLLLDSFGHVGASYERAAEDGAETDRLAVTAIALEGLGFDEFLDR